MKENNREENKINNTTEKNEQNNEHNNEVKDGNSLEYVKNKHLNFISIFRERRNNLNKEIEIEKKTFNNRKKQLEKFLEDLLEDLEEEKRNLNTQKYEDNYEKVEKYISEIIPRVEKRYQEIDKKTKEEIAIKKEKSFVLEDEEKRLKKDDEILKQHFYYGLETCLKKGANDLLRPKVMCNDDLFNTDFSTFKGKIDYKINNTYSSSTMNNLIPSIQQLNDFCESDKGHSSLYKFFRNALYRQGYLLFYNTARVISNMRIEYDIWHSDTGKHIWGVNCSPTFPNIYYKYHSAWNYRVFKFNFFYIEFRCSLYHLLLKPLRYISRWGSVLRSKVNGNPTSTESDICPFWDMINISLVQISVGPVNINGLSFSLFDPIFFVMSLCFQTYLGFHSKYDAVGALDTLTKYSTTPDNFREKKYLSHEVNVEDKKILEEHWNSFKNRHPKLYKLKKILQKNGLVTPEGTFSSFMYSFKSYFKKNIFHNIARSIMQPYEKRYFFRYFITIVCDAFILSFKSAPEIFLLFFPYNYPCYKQDITTIHERKMFVTYYIDAEFVDIHSVGSKDFIVAFRCLCDMFFLSLALLVYSMIDSISIDLRWFIENESVRRYCVKLKREVCKFFQR